MSSELNNDAENVWNTFQGILDDVENVREKISTELGALGIPEEDIEQMMKEVMQSPSGPCNLCGGPHPDGSHGYWQSQWTEHQFGEVEAGQDLTVNVSDGMGFSQNADRFEL